MDDQSEGCFSMETILRQQQSARCADDGDGLQLLSFQDFNNITFDIAYAFDVIGRLINNKDITVLNGKNGSKKSSLEFELQDLKSDIIRCILWNDLAKKLHKYIKENEKSQEPIIILIIMAKYSTWNHVTQVSNCFYRTKILINEKNPRIIDFKTRIKVQIRMQDETGSASFWIFQQEICKLIDKSPGYLISKAKKISSKHSQWNMQRSSTKTDNYYTKLRTKRDWEKIHLNTYNSIIRIDNSEDNREKKRLRNINNMVSHNVIDIEDCEQQQNLEPTKRPRKTIEISDDDDEDA
ncbi:nucleic acid-binding, OB-fold protein [Tanacetum coccineum]